MKVEADERMAGFELFGGPILNKAVGFKAANFVTDELFFPQVTAKAPIARSPTWMETCLDLWAGLKVRPICE